MNATKWDSKVLLLAGVGLLVLAGGFLWHDLQVRTEALVAVMAVVAAGLTMAKVPSGKPILGPVALIATSAVGGLWYAATKEPVLLVALCVVTAASAFSVWRANRNPATQEDKLQTVLTWFGLAVSVIATSWVAYFQFLTLTLAPDEIGRRLVLTSLWLVAGVALVLFSNKRGQPVIRDTGFLFLAVAVGKALLYDTTHLYGGLRIAMLGAAGALLLGSGLVTSRMQAMQAKRS